MTVLRVLVVWLALATPAFASDRSGLDARPGARLPLDERFSTSTGRSVALGDVIGRGKPALLVLAYNRCAMLCSLVLRGVADVTRKLDRESGDEFTLVSISIDPRDTPDEAARVRTGVLERAGIPERSDRWAFLVGAKPAIDRVARQVGFRYGWDARTEQYAHPAVVFVISPRGEVVQSLQGIEFEPDQIRAALSGTTVATSMSAPRSLLECFRFEATRRRYGGVVQRLFQIGSASVFVALAVVVVGLVRRERRRS